MTPGKCQAFCLSSGFQLYGVEYSSECYCGNAITQCATQLSQSSCANTCSGSSELCGGSNAIEIYAPAGVTPARTGCASSSSSSSIPAVSTTTSSVPSSTSAAAAAFYTVGCYQDFYPNARTLNGPSTSSDNMTPSQCQAFCSQQGYQLSGTEYSRECYCGSSITQCAPALAQSSCSNTCSGDSSQTCGGSNAIEIYAPRGVTPTVSGCATSSSSSSASSSTVATTATSASSAATPLYSALGCYQDYYPNGRTLNGASTSSDNMTPAVCQQFCASQGQTTYGVEYGRECYCSANTISQCATKLSQSSCNYACSGDNSQLCGGDNAIQIFEPVGATPVVQGCTSSSATASATPTAVVNNAASSSSKTVPTSTSSARAPVYTQLGCYNDFYPNGRTLNATSTSSDSMTVEACQSFCAGYNAFGIEYSKECYCGNAITMCAQPQAQSNCQNTCAGNSAELCGGSNYLEIYALQGVALQTTGC